MITHSSFLDWRIPWPEEPRRLQSLGMQRVGHAWSNWACMHPTNIISLPYLPLLPSMVLHLQIQPTTDQQYLGKNSTKFQKAKLEFATCWQLFPSHLYCIYNYLHSIYIVLGIVSNILEKEMAIHCSFLAWRTHGQESLVGYSPWGHNKSEITEAT